MQFMHFSGISAMLAVLATSVTRGTHFEVCEWDVVTVYAY